MSKGRLAVSEGVRSLGTLSCTSRIEVVFEDLASEVHGESQGTILPAPLVPGALWKVNCLSSLFRQCRPTLSSMTKGKLGP